MRIWDPNGLELWLFVELFSLSSKNKAAFLLYDRRWAFCF